MSYHHNQRADRFGSQDFTPPTDRRSRRGEFPSEEGDWHRGGGRRGFGPGSSGPGGPGAMPGGPEGPRGRGRGHGGGRGRGRAGRGDVRAAILLLLVDQPMHGYQLIQEISERSSGGWRPSPGAVYPALNLLQDEGYVEISSEGGRRMATLTETGRTYVAEHSEELGDPWQDAAGRGHGRHHEVRDAASAMTSALHQVFQTGTESQIDEAVRILDRARRDLYLVLAGPEETATKATTPSPEDGSSESTDKD